MIDRDTVRREALTWLGTPWRHCAAIKGVGVDCAQLIFKTLQACSLIAPDLELSGYSPQYHLHRHKEVFRSCVEQIAAEVLPENCNLADIVLYKFGKVFNHGGLVIDWPVIIHTTKHIGTVLDDAGKLTVASLPPLEVKYYRFLDDLRNAEYGRADYIKKRPEVAKRLLEKDKG